MLTTLRIKNLALVPDLTVELAPGYNVITGETGAGKSVIIGALNLVLGERADRTSIRAGSDSCSVEALFKLDKLALAINHFLQEKGLDPCDEGELILRRSFTASGANKQFINGSPATLSTLAELGEFLVDMHGPHEHQSLLHVSRQLNILDAFGRLQPLREKFASLLQERNALLEKKSALIIDERTYAQQLDLLRFQTHEIANAKLIPGEDQQLEIEYERSSNAARLIELAQNGIDLLSESESSLLSASGALGRVLNDLVRLDSSADQLRAIHQQANDALQELQRELGHYADQVQVDPAQLQQLEQRLNLIQGLKRKYGASLDDVIQFGNDARARLDALESRDEELERLNTEIKKIESTLWTTGRELSAARKKIIPKLTRAVVKQLNDLGFKQSEFDVHLATDSPGENQNWTPSGIDHVEFQFAPNPGEPSRPLKAIASSGELARVMLALKTVLAAEDEVPVLVFDEVDANIGGETARAVGEKMRQIGSQRQVISITHLAPVAAFGNRHFVVTKEVTANRTISRIDPVDGPARIDELTRMLGGGDAARKHAQAILIRE